jgi:hypothetical protein
MASTKLPPVQTVMITSAMISAKKAALAGNAKDYALFSIRAKSQFKEYMDWLDSKILEQEQDISELPY